MALRAFLDTVQPCQCSCIRPSWKKTIDSIWKPLETSAEDKKQEKQVGQEVELLLKRWMSLSRFVSNVPLHCCWDGNNPFSKFLCGTSVPSVTDWTRTGLDRFCRVDAFGWPQWSARPLGGANLRRLRPISPVRVGVHCGTMQIRFRETICTVCFLALLFFNLFLSSLPLSSQQLYGGGGQGAHRQTDRQTEQMARTLLGSN